MHIRSVKVHTSLLETRSLKFKVEKLNLRLKLKVKVGRGSKLRSAKRKRVIDLCIQESIQQSIQK